MRILLLGNQSDGSDIDEVAYYERFADFFRTAGLDCRAHIDFALTSDLLFEVSNGTAVVREIRNNRELKDYDIVFFRGQFRKRLDVIFAVSRYMHMHGRMAVNDHSYCRTSSKLSQAIIFSELHVPTPHTLCGSARVLDLQYGVLKLPFICKEVYGAHGSYNYLISAEAQLRRVLREGVDGLYVLQEFVPNDGDYRLLIIGKNHLIIKRTAAPGSHLNNTSQGGRAELLDPGALPDEVIGQARRCMHYLGMSIAGIDIMYDKMRGMYVFLEVNAQPQLLTGAFTEEKQQLLGRYLADLTAGLA